MNVELVEDDRAAIEAIVHRQFASLCWTPTKAGDWSAFAADFLADADLYPSARPLRQQSVAEFVTRMKGLSQSAMTSFHERALDIEVVVFGNVAVAIAAGEITENVMTVNRGVEMMLLTKDSGTWKIVAQAWDNEKPDQPIPNRWLKA